MTAKQIFQIIIATFGLMVLFQGLFYLVDAALFLCGLYHLQHSEPSYYAMKGVIEIACGAFLMAGHSTVAAMVFRSRVKPADQSTAANS